MNRFVAAILLFLAAAQSSVHGQPSDSTWIKLTRYAYAIQQFGRALPQEKVYLHFDNTSYYQGDKIWFQCYVVTPGLNRPTELSKTLYVELLNPGGEVMDKRILPIRNGRCHGDFSLNRLPFYSGFYEIRAYTKYMLNFGEDIIFSRIFPVFDPPEKTGDFSEKNIRKYTVYKYPQKRERPRKDKKINLKFYPEGGYLVQGLPAHVAFEATDAYGNPVELSGTVSGRDGKEPVGFSVTHEGRGAFLYTPGAKSGEATVTLGGKNYRFDLPEPLPEGFTLHVDNLASADSVAVTVQKSRGLPATALGLAVMCAGKLLDHCLIRMETEPPAVSFKLDKTGWPAGVAQIVLFDQEGRIVADRLIFTRRPDRLHVEVRKNKETYQPYEPVEMELSVRDTEGRPVQAPLSVSVRDGADEVESRHSLLTGLLLMSEIKGYVRRPSYYFESDDSTRRLALDRLLMVQGWRRYAWKWWSGTEPFDLKYLPEQGIEVRGQVVSMVKGKPKPGVQVSSFLIGRGEEETAKASYIHAFDTDSLGRFAFVSDIRGKWNLILSVMEKGKKKDYRILLDRVFSPEPVQYPLAEMQVSVDTAGIAQDFPADTVAQEEADFNAFMKAYEDSLSKAGIHEKIHRVGEVVIKAKKQSREKDIYNSRSKSIAYYDVVSEIDDIKDRGDFIGDDIHELLVRMNNYFSHYYSLGQEYVTYKGRTPLFVVNYERTMATEMDYNKYKLLRTEAIRSIYISEELSAKCQYGDPRMSPLEADELYSCVVFIETYPEGQVPAEAGKGVRKTWLDGYSEVKEFYQPDYSVLPRENDYRRTLYWNPALMPDEAGNATIRFYNNSCSHPLKVSAETISADGTIGTFGE